MVLGIVFMTIALLIQYAYTEHDKVTGTMILEEMLMRAKRDNEGEDTDIYYEEMGKQLGNPRLWLGEYEIDISMEQSKAVGKASAGDWNKEIEMGLFQPSTYLRRAEFLEDIWKERMEKDGEGNDDREYRVQEGNESELYGNSFGIGAE